MQCDQCQHSLRISKTLVLMKRLAKTAEAPSYHHGNLRQALLAKALTSLRKGGVERLSLRELARSLGVSQAAPYRHFPDKESLLAELATQGFRELARDMRASMQGDDRAPAALQAAGLGYIHFAIRHPEQYRLMFGNWRIEKGRYSSFDEAAADAFGVLLTVIQRGVDSGNYRDEPVMALALAAWSIVHGFASLAIDGQLAVVGTAEEASLAEQVTRLLRVGIERSQR
jgi:AcrR family transcriptional regulator